MKDAYWIHPHCQPISGREHIAKARDADLAANPPYGRMHWLVVFNQPDNPYSLSNIECGICDQAFKDGDAATGFRVEREDIMDLSQENLTLRNRIQELENAIREHRAQKADDRCIEDDDRLYAVLKDGIPCDRRVGSKEEMLKNCARYIERRCQQGHWPTYAELEANCQELNVLLTGIYNESLSCEDAGDFVLSVQDRLAKRRS